MIVQVSHKILKQCCLAYVPNIAVQRQLHFWGICSKICCSKFCLVVYASIVCHAFCNNFLTICLSTFYTSIVLFILLLSFKKCTPYSKEGKSFQYHLRLTIVKFSFVISLKGSTLNFTRYSILVFLPCPNCKTV